MSTNERPFFMPGMHPVELGKYVIVTAPIFRLFTALCRWMIGLKSGCIVYGQSRIGKTWSITALTSMLKKEFGDISILSHSMLEHQKRTEKEFFRNMLGSFEHARADLGNAGQKFDVMIDFLVEEANKNDCKRLLLFIDEAQWLKAIEYGYLRGIFNMLQKRDVLPMFVLVGDDSLYKEYETYKTLNNKEITGRFMNEIYQFRGARTEKEVHIALHGYDITEAPEGSGWTFTKYFFPSAYESGWRLASQAKILRNTYTEIIREENKQKSTIEIPMSHLAPAVQHLLTTYSDLDIKAPIFSRDAWYEALDFAIRPTHRRPPSKK